jgi:hypothetical protein
MPSVSARSETTLRNPAHTFLFNRVLAGLRQSNRRAFDKSLQMLMQMQGKDKQAWEQKKRSTCIFLRKLGI